MQLLLPQQFASFDENVLGEANLQPCHFTFASFALRLRVRRVHEKTEDDCSKCTILQSSTAQHLTSSHVVVTQLTRYSHVFTSPLGRRMTNTERCGTHEKRFKTQSEGTVKIHEATVFASLFFLRKYVHIYIIYTHI